MLVMAMGQRMHEVISVAVCPTAVDGVTDRGLDAGGQDSIRLTPCMVETCGTHNPGTRDTRSGLSHVIRPVRELQRVQSRQLVCPLLTCDVVPSAKPFNEMFSISWYDHRDSTSYSTNSGS